MNDILDEILESAFSTADTHADRMQSAFTKLSPFYPFQADFFDPLLDEHLLIVELFIGRFAKLQDFMGTKLFDLVLEATKEYADKLTFIDKLNLLEKRSIIDDAHIWDKLRKTRNDLAHEYPDKPQLMADNLNKAFLLAPVLLKTLENCHATVERARKYR
ncbi:MAG: hypothetical protein WCG04_03705 [Alphaproteobacteria bacterium]